MLFFDAGGDGMEGGVRHKFVSAQVASRRWRAGGVRAALEPPGDTGARLRGCDARFLGRIWREVMCLVILIVHG